MPAARHQMRCQMPDRVQRMPDTRLDARYQFENGISNMETTEYQYMNI